MNQNNIVDIIDVEQRHYKIIKEILSSFLPYKKVIAYGSRVKWNASDTSDLDLVVFNATQKEIYEAKEAFDESNIPFIIQLLNWDTIPQDFKENIEQKYHILQKEDDWGIFKLGDVAEVKYGKDHKSLSNGKYPCFGSGGFMRSVDSFLHDDESILIPRKGSLNNIIYQDKPFWTVDTMFWTKIDKEKANPKFLFYQLTPIDYTTLNVGSAVPSLTVPVINEIEIHLPPLPEQKAIAEILSSLDDKIDLLHRQNKTLESLAESLFRHYFIDNAKDDWDSEEIGKYVNVVDNRGKTPPNQTEVTQYPVIEVNALGKGDRLVDYSLIRKYVDKNTFENWFRAKPKKYDILVSTVGSIGEFSMFILEVGNIAQNIIALQAKEISPFYLYQVLKYKHEEVMTLDIGGVQPSIKVPHLLSIIIPIPEIDVQKEFDIQIIEFVKKMETNYLQIQTLEKLRDTLLPNLISGEIRVQYEGV